jgi:hypothetical protein
MGRGLLQTHLDAFDTVGAHIAGKRREGYNNQYEYADAIKSTYGYIFFLPTSVHAGIPGAAETEAGTVQRADHILRVDKIPSASHITQLLDGITPEDFSAVFNAGMRIFFNRYVFETWEDFIGFVGQDDEPDR